MRETFRLSPLFVACCAFGQLTGTVQNSLSKLPLAHVRIHADRQTVESSDTGEFRVEGVAPGKYLVFFNADGYEDGHAAIQVSSDGARLRLEMKPLAELAGVVRDEDGKPLESVVVSIGGHRYTTGKDGRFDAQAIASGTYSLAVRVPYGLRRQTLLRDEARGETFGYANVTDLPLPVTLSPGARVMNFDIDLRRGPLVELKGKLVDAPAGAEIELDSAKGLPDGPYGKRKLDEHAGFRFELLEPGDYMVVVHRNREGDDLPYLAPVHVGEAGVQDLEVELPTFARIEGTVRTPREDLKWSGTLRVTLGRMGYETEVRVGPEGRFILNAIPPGEWYLSIDANLAHRADDVASRMYVNPAPPKTLRVTESGNPPLEFLLTGEAGKITGTADEAGLVTVTEAGGSFSSGKVAEIARDGSFHLDVAPGEYRVGLDAAAPCSQLVTVQGGESVSVHLKACTASGQ